MGYRVPSPIHHNYDWNDSTPFKAQRATAAMLVCEPRAFVLSGMGCVDSETEYLSPTGWRRIADYEGGMVAQYSPRAKRATFVEPTKFVKLPCDEMVEVKTTRGIDQLLSPEHRVLLEHRSSGETKVVHAEDLLGSNREFQHWGVPTTFYAGGPGLDLSDAEIRLMVAVKADGYLRSDCRPGWVFVRLKRQRKKDRLRRLLKAASVEWRETSKDSPTAQGFTVFRFVAPEASKTFDAWWPADNHQLCVIADELPHWGGSFRKAGGVQWSSRNKADADFAQYAFSATGRTASMKAQGRDSGKDYTVYVRDNDNPISFYGVRSDGSEIQNTRLRPSTDGFKYCFMVPTTFLVFRRNGKVFVSGNTGKTRSVLFAYDYLRKEKLVRNMLVVAPLSTLNFTWAREVFQNFPYYRVGVIHGKTRREKVLADDRFDIYVINHDGVKILEDKLIQRRFDIICIDEVATFRNARTARHKSMARVAESSRSYLWGLTGTPTPRDPTDAYGIIKLITPGNKKVTSFARFRDMLMQKVTNFKYVPRTGAQDKVFALMQPAVRYTMDDCVDMPPVVYSSREVAMGKKQQRAYEELRKYCTVTVGPEKIKAANEAVLINKLIQVSSGCIYDAKKNVTMLDAQHRLNAALEAVEQNDAKSIIFCPFIPLVGMVAEHLRSKGCKTYEITGAVSSSRRSDIFAEFQDTKMGDCPEVLVAHPGTMSHGLTLTAASMIMWYAPLDNLEIYQQANARIARPGQTSHKVQVLHLVASPADRRIYKRLENKEKVQGILLDLFE